MFTERETTVCEYKYKIETLIVTDHFLRTLLP